MIHHSKVFGLCMKPLIKKKDNKRAWKNVSARSLYLRCFYWTHHVTWSVVEIEICFYLFSLTSYLRNEITHGQTYHSTQSVLRNVFITFVQLHDEVLPGNLMSRWVTKTYVIAKSFYHMDACSNRCKHTWLKVKSFYRFNGMMVMMTMMNTFCCMVNHQNRVRLNMSNPILPQKEFAHLKHQCLLGSVEWKFALNRVKI